MASGTERPLKVRDVKKHVRSMGVSTVYRDERERQQYQLYDIWSRIALAGLSNNAIPDVDENESGIALFEKIVNACNVGGEDGDKTELVFNVRVDRFKEEITDVESMLASIKRADTDTSEWFVQKNWIKFGKNCIENNEKEIVVNYSAILRKGFRQLFGTSNVQVESIKDKSIYKELAASDRIIVHSSCCH